MGLEGIAVAICGTQFLVGLLVVPQFYSYFRNMTKDKKFDLNLLQIR